MSIKTLMTAAEFAETGPETDGYELVKGELRPMPPAKQTHGLVCGNVTAFLWNYKKSRGAGVVLSNDTGIITEKDPDTVRGVDVALFLNPKAATKSKGYITVPPDLAVEVRSDGQPWKELLAKSHEYLQMGARMVWVVDPSVQRMTVFECDREPITYAAENQFDGGDVLPGLQFKISELFA